MTMFFQNFTKEKSDELTFLFAQKFANESGDEELTRLVEKRDIAALVAYPIDYTDGCDPLRVIAKRQCLALFTKRDDLELGVDKEAVALDKFIEAEVTCASTNVRLSKPGWRLDKTNCFTSAVLQIAEEKIASILGECPSIPDLHMTFGPGASTTCQRTTTARWKLSTKPACSADMLSIVSDVLDEMPHYTALHADSETETGHSIKVGVVPGRLMFVPKNAKTMRSIMVEPLLNSFLQKGYGQWMKTRLLRAGINLFDQTLNQRRAKIGSLNNSLATVDLSSASDTISLELVRLLLPSDWFWALNRARTSRVEYDPEKLLQSLFRGPKELPPNLIHAVESMADDGVSDQLSVTFQLNKFSSMGNAFTFELESVIFYALTYAVCVVSGQKPDVSVYGDDIICPTSMLSRLTEVFDFCGFSINKSKSFGDGPFRESCGADYFKGLNVRPFYQKTTWSPATLCAFHNFLVRGDLHHLYPDLVEFLVETVGEENRLFGPDGYGDGHFLVREWSSHCKHLNRSRGWAGYSFDTFVKLAQRVKKPIPGDRILPAYSIYVSSEGGSDHFAVSGSRGSKRISIYTLGR